MGPYLCGACGSLLFTKLDQCPNCMQTGKIHEMNTTTTVLVPLEYGMTAGNARLVGHDVPDSVPDCAVLTHGDLCDDIVVEADEQNANRINFTVPARWEWAEGKAVIELPSTGSDFEHRLSPPGAPPYAPVDGTPVAPQPLHEGVTAAEARAQGERVPASIPDHATLGYLDVEADVRTCHRWTWPGGASYRVPNHIVRRMQMSENDKPVVGVVVPARCGGTTAECRKLTSGGSGAQSSYIKERPGSNPTLMLGESDVEVWQDATSGRYCILGSDGDSVIIREEEIPLLVEFLKGGGGDPTAPKNKAGG